MHNAQKHYSIHETFVPYVCNFHSFNVEADRSIS